MCSDPKPSKSVSSNRPTIVIPSIYFNGFAVELGPGDVTILLKHNDAPVGRLSSSYTVTKSLREALENVIGHLEQQCSTKIMSIDEVSKNLLEEAEK
jgi:hypothetical protein